MGLGTLPGLLRLRSWEGHAINLRNHYWSLTADPATLSFDTAVEDVVATLDRLGPTTVAVGHGMGALLALKAAERWPSPAWCSSGPRCRVSLRPPARPHELREVPEVYGRSLIGWETPPERPLRDDRDLTLSDAMRIQHLLGQKPHEAGRPAARSSPVSRSTGGWCPRCPAWSSPVASTATSSLDDAERLAEWLDAGFEPFGAHSHYGLIHGEASYQQVAEAVRTFLETYRL